MADTPQNLDLSQFGGTNELDMSQFQPPAPPEPRGGFAEVGTGLARGALADLPTMAGQALQFAGANSLGTTVRNFGQGMAAQPWLTMQPESHSGFTNAIASGAEQLPSIGAAALGAGAAALAAPEVLGGGLVASALGAAPGAAMFAGAHAQGTLEAAQAKGLTPDAAQAASRLDYATNFATQVGAGLVGGKLLAGASGALSKAVGSEGAPLASQVLDQLTGNNGWLMPGLKAAATGAVENTALGAAQTATSAAINNAYGIDDQDPMSAALQSIPQSLSLSGVLGGLGLASRALQVRAAAAKTATLADAKTDPALRQKYADEYTQALPLEAQQAFAANAKTAIDNNQPLSVDTGMFTPGSVQPPATPPNPALAQINPGAGLPTQDVVNQNVGTSNPLPLAPDGTVLTRKDFGALPANDGLKGQDLATAYKAYVADPDVQARAQRAANFGAAYSEPSGQYGADPVTGQERELTMGEVMERQAGVPATPEAAPAPTTPLLPYNTPPEAVDQMVANSNGLVKKVGDEYTFPDGSKSTDINDVQDFMTRQAAEQNNQPAALQLLHNPTPPEVEQMVATSDGLVQKVGDTYKFPDGSTTTDIKQVQSFFADKAQQEAARAADPTLPKASDEIANDIVTANKTVTGDDEIKAQALKPLQKQLDSLGLDKLDTHQAQIDALSARLSDEKASIGPATRERMEALLTQWKGAVPQEPAQGGTPIVTTPAEPSGNATISPEATPAMVGTTAVPLPEAPAQASTLPENIPASVETQAPAAASAALPENIPASVTSQSPGADEALPNNLTQSPRSHAQDTADMVDATLADFNTRIRGGEKLSPLEQERMEDLQGMRKSLAEVTAGGNSDEYSQNISEMAREAATKPYTESYRHYRVGTPEDTDPGIMLDALKTGKLNDTLNTIAQNGSTPEVQALAKKIAPLVPDTTIRYAGPDGTGAVGEYQPATNHVNIFPGGESEQTILHESTHAAQQAQVARAEQIVTPKTQREAELKKSLATIESIRQTAIDRAGVDSQYGLTNAHEFLAELNSNPEFQTFLKSEQLNKQSLWARAVTAVKSLLDMKSDQGNFLDKAMEANESFFQKPEDAGFPLPQGSTQDNLFRKSPADAAKVTDDQYGKLGKLADAVTDKVDVTKLNQASYRALASWKTVQYLADRIRAMPEMVQSGFARGLDAYQQAHESKRIAKMFVEKPLAAYAERVTKTLNKLPADQQRDLSRQMMTIGGEASRGGFDYRMNYADNIKAGRDVPAANKGYVDDIHRQFTQLQRTNPEAAQALVDGQLQMHKTLINTTATLARNLMDNAAGTYTKLSAAARPLADKDGVYRTPEAQQAARSAAAAAPGNHLAENHAAKLDFMGKDLAAARNTKPDTYADGATQALDARLSAMFKDARALPDGSPLKGHLGELEQMYRAQSQNPYFSLGRSGDYFVKASLKGVDEATQQKIQNALKGSNKVIGNLVGNDGNIFFRTDTQDQAMGLHQKLIDAAGTKMVPDSNAWGKLAYNDAINAQGVSPALRSMLSDLHSTVENSGLSGDAADAMRSTLTRSLLSLLPETSSRSAKMSRQGVPGYDADYLGNFSRRAMGSVQDMSNIYTQKAFDDSFNQMKASVGQLNRTGTPEGRIRAQDTLDEISKRYANSQKSMDNTTINTINSLGHAFYLAMSPAYLIRTTAQPFHRALPLLGSRYGFVNSAKEIGGATKDALAITGNSLAKGWQTGGVHGVLDANMDFQNSKLSDSEKAFVQELHDRGILNLGQTRQLQNAALGGTQRQQDLQRFASITAQAAEMTNRLATGLAAFRLAEKGTKNVTQEGHAANTEYAINAIDRAMDNFDPTNTARAIGKQGIAGKFTPLMTAFMNYNLQTMQQISRTVHDGLFNQDKSAAGLQRASEARKEFTGLMATTMMISGAMGLPFANVFAGLYNTYKDQTDPDNPGDIRIDAQNYLSNTLGKTAGEVISHGLPRLANFDSSTFGLENLLPGSEFLSSRQLLSDRLADTSASLMGPALNGGIGILQAMDKMKDGYVAKGIEAALPSGLKPYFKAYQLAEKGYTDSKDNPLPMAKPTGWDIARQMAGFNSGTKATESEAAGYAQMRDERLQYQKGLVQDRFFKGATSGDPAQMSAAAKQMMDYNNANPTQPITNPGESIRQKMLAYSLGQYSGLGFGVNVKQLPVLQANLAFARDSAMPGE